MPIGDEPIGGGPISGDPGGETPTTPTVTAGECPARAGAGAETDFLNDALGQIGESAITAIDDGSTNANYCQRFYPTLRDALLRGHHWKFATTRAQLALVAVVPVYDFAYAFGLPSNFLKLIECNGINLFGSSINAADLWMIGQTAFRIERRTLVTNDSEAFITYIARIEDPTQWDPMFYQMASTWLASKLALAISKDAKTAQALLELAMSLRSTAMAVDGQERSVQPMRVMDLIWGR